MSDLMFFLIFKVALVGAAVAWGVRELIWLRRDRERREAAKAAAARPAPRTEAAEPQREAA